MTGGRFEETLGHLVRSWNQAIDTGEPEVRCIQVAGRVLRFEAAGTTTIDQLWPALAHHPTVDTEVADPSLTVRLWDLATTGAARPPLPEAFFEANRTLMRDYAADDDVSLRFDSASQSLTAWSRSQRLAWCCLEDPLQIPWWEHAAPFRALLSWWLEDDGRPFIHGGVIGDESGAVVLAGPGGSGKSTTTVLCSLAGLGYLGDDYCAMSLRPQAQVDSLYSALSLRPPGPMAHSLYSSAKLRPDDGYATGPLAGHLLREPSEQDEKVVAFIGEIPGTRMVASAPIAAVMAVRVGTDPRTRVSPASQAEALKALAPSSILQLRGIGAPTMAALAELVRSVPVGILELGRDGDEIVATVAALAQGKLLS